jgi:hypothetical protein
MLNYQRVDDLCVAGWWYTPTGWWLMVINGDLMMVNDD